MALYVNTNVSSINAQRRIRTLAVQAANGTNTAKDRKALQEEVSALSHEITRIAQKSTFAGAQILDGGKNVTIAVQAANGTNTAKDRKALQEEVSALSHEITRIAQKSTFAGAQILDGGKNVTNGLMRKIGQTDNYEYFFQVGANAQDEITLQCGAFTMKGIATAAGIHNLNAMSDNQKINDKLTKAGLVTSNNQLVWAVDTPEIAQKTLNYVDKFIELVDSKRAALGAIAGLVTSNNQLVWAVDTPEIAQKTLNYVDKFIELVDSKRAALGAIQNRMESTIRNQSSISENESDARSRIRDTDFASETAALTSNQIIQQASQTILTQANQSNQIIQQASQTILTQANQRPTIALQLLGQ